MRRTKYTSATRKNNRTSRYTTTTKRNTWNSPSYPCNSPKFSGPKNECQWRIGSYRNVYSQFTGAGNKTVFSPTIANKWVRYVNNGVQVYKFTNKDFCRYFGMRWATATPTAARKYLYGKYGSKIKDVVRGKGNCWLVATTKTPTVRPFTNYNWI
jgi:hypothetical protein